MCKSNSLHLLGTDLLCICCRLFCSVRFCTKHNSMAGLGTGQWAALSNLISARGRSFLGPRFGVMGGGSNFGLPALFLSVTPVVHKVLVMHVWNSNRLYFWGNSNCFMLRWYRSHPFTTASLKTQYTILRYPQRLLIPTLYKAMSIPNKLTPPILALWERTMEGHGTSICWLVVFYQRFHISSGPTVLIDDNIVIDFFLVQPYHWE